MARIFAQTAFDATRNARVVRQVIVVESAALAAQLVPGTQESDWVETFQDGRRGERYAGMDDTYDGTRTERFVVPVERAPRTAR